MQMRWLDLRHRVTLAEAKLADLKIALEDMRAQRDAWQAMAQARIRPARRPPEPVAMASVNRMTR